MCGHIVPSASSNTVKFASTFSAADVSGGDGWQRGGSGGSPMSPSLASSSGHSTPTALSSAFKRILQDWWRNMLFKPLHCNNWAWKIKREKANVSHCTVMHLCDMWAVSGTWIPPEKRIPFRKNVWKKKLCMRSPLLPLSAQSKRY